MQHADEFRKWVLDPSRTNDELFTAERLVDWGHRVWCSIHEQHDPPDWERDNRERGERVGNPAYRAKINPLRVEHTIEVAARLTNMTCLFSNDRHVRDLKAFRFFPATESLALGDVELCDLSPLAGLENLRNLRYQEPRTVVCVAAEDFSGLAALTRLETLALIVVAPWPDLSALASLPLLSTFAFTGNNLALRDVPAMPGVRVAVLDSGFHYKTPVRDLRDIPEMPQLRRLKLESTARLRGIERYPELVNLELEGPFSDLSPLVCLSKLTSLTLKGEQFVDLAPLAKLPELREVVFVRERPFDLAPLAESASLREVRVERCNIVRTELAALNIGLVPWDVDFFAPQPRPLKPLRALCYSSQSEEVRKLERHLQKDEARDAHYGDDAAMLLAESRWFATQYRTRLAELLGWAKPSGSDMLGYYTPGGGSVSIKRYRDVMRMPEILQTLRQLMSECRFRWKVMIDIEPHGDLSDDMEEIRKRYEQEEGDWLCRVRSPEQDKAEHEDFIRRRRELYARYEREHRLKLIEQAGGEIKPEDFRVPPPAETNQPANDDDLDDDDEELDEDDGDLAEPPPEHEGSGLGRELRCIVHLEEDFLWVTSHMKDDAEYLLSVRTEDWHALPEPPEKRPTPR